MGEWLNNLRSQLTQLQNDDEAGAVLGKKRNIICPGIGKRVESHQPQKNIQSLEIDSVFRGPKRIQNNR